MTGQQLWEAARDGDAAKVSTLLSTQGAQSFINYQGAHGYTPLHLAADQGHEAVTKQLLAARCNVDLKDTNGLTALQAAERLGHAGVATLIRNKRQEAPLLRRRVAINGLVAKPELNGRTGTAMSFDDAKGCYSVELDDTSSSLMIKPCNLLPTPVCSVALCSLLFSWCRL